MKQCEPNRSKVTTAIEVDMDTVTVRFPGIDCCICGENLQHQTACVHPSMTGPKGGKKYCHEHCLEGEARHNPFIGGNPDLTVNAGRRTRRGKRAVGSDGNLRLPERQPGDPAYMIMTVEELVEEGTDDALRELARRDRAPSGVKLAWTKGKSGTKAKYIGYTSKKSRESGHTRTVRPPGKDMDWVPGKGWQALKNSARPFLGKWSDRYSFDEE